jgi:hypothetical protein
LKRRLVVSTLAFIGLIAAIAAHQLISSIVIVRHCLAKKPYVSRVSLRLTQSMGECDRTNGSVIEAGVLPPIPLKLLQKRKVQWQNFQMDLFSVKQLREMEVLV